jgi:hypothetical protein
MDSIVLVSMFEPDGERFLLIDFDLRVDFVEKFAKAFTTEPAEERVRAFRQGWADFTKGRSAWTEADARVKLAERGLGSDEIEQKIVKARRFREWAPQSAWDRLTDLGYCNDHRQTVVRKTDRFGTGLFQRVYVLRCEKCGHEHDVDGCDIHVARCPNCQDLGIGDQDSGPA